MLSIPAFLQGIKASGRRTEARYRIISSDGAYAGSPSPVASDPATRPFLT